MDFVESMKNRMLYKLSLDYGILFSYILIGITFSISLCSSPATFVSLSLSLCHTNNVLSISVRIIFHIMMYVHDKWHIRTASENINWSPFQQKLHCHSLCVCSFSISFMRFNHNKYGGINYCWVSSTETYEDGSICVLLSLQRYDTVS